MRQPGAVMIAFVEHENLGFVLQPAERVGMNHPVAIAPERAAGLARRLRKQPPAAAVGTAGIDGARSSHSDRPGHLPLIHLILQHSALNYSVRPNPTQYGMPPIHSCPCLPS